jgi:hypothetical protein
MARKKCARGVLLYDGDAVVPFGERMVAAPGNTAPRANVAATVPGAPKQKPGACTPGLP